MLEKITLKNNIPHSSIKRLEKTAMLYDFYGAMLTKKQCDVIEMYFMENLSLQEIGDETGATKQAVSDLIKRTENKLYNYEQKLGMLEKFGKSKQAFLSFADELDSLLLSSDIESLKMGIKKVKDNLTYLLDEL